MNTLEGKNQSMMQAQQLSDKETNIFSLAQCQFFTQLTEPLPVQDLSACHMAVNSSSIVIIVSKNKLWALKCGACHVCQPAKEILRASICSILLPSIENRCNLSRALEGKINPNKLKGKDMDLLPPIGASSEYFLIKIAEIHKKDKACTNATSFPPGSGKCKPHSVLMELDCHFQFSIWYYHLGGESLQTDRPTDSWAANNHHRAVKIAMHMRLDTWIQSLIGLIEIVVWCFGTQLLFLACPNTSSARAIQGI